MTKEFEELKKSLSKPIGTKEQQIDSNGEKHWHMLIEMKKTHPSYNYVRKGLPKAYWVHDNEKCNCVITRASKRVTGRI